MKKHFTVIALVTLIAAQAIGRADESAPAIDIQKVIKECTAMLKSEDVKERRRGAQRLGWLGPLAKSAVPDLCRAYADKDNEVIAYAGLALAEMREAAKDALPMYMEMLRHDDYYDRYDACCGLATIGPEAKAAVPQLIDLLKDRNAFLRENAAHALGRIGKGAEAAVHGLTEALKDEKDSVRVRAARALWDISKSKKGIPVVHDVLQRRYPDSIADPKDPMAVIFAITFLPEFGAEAKISVPLLKRMISDRRNISAWAAKALWMINKDDAALAYLIEEITERPVDPNGAISALGAIGPEAKAAVPVLLKILVSEKGRRLSAAKALWFIDKHKLAIPTLVEALKSDEHRSFAADALDEIGPGNIQEAIPTLKGLLQHQEERVRFQAVRLLLKIDPQVAADAGVK